MDLFFAGFFTGIVVTAIVMLIGGFLAALEIERRKLEGK